MVGWAGRVGLYAMGLWGCGGPWLERGARLRSWLCLWTVT